MNRAPSNILFSDRPGVPVMDEVNPVLNTENSSLMVGARNNDDDDECTTDNCRDNCRDTWNDPLTRALCVVSSSVAGLILGLQIGELTTADPCLGAAAGGCSACWASFFAVGGREGCASINYGFLDYSRLRRIREPEPNNSLSR